MTPVPAEEVVQLDAAELAALTTTFATPHWLRDLGRTSWALVGVTALLIAVTWVLGQTSTIVVPVIVGLVVATVAAPIVSVLQRKRVPRALGALIVLLGLVVVAIIILLLVVGGIVSQSDTIGAHLSAALDKIEGWLKSAGISSSGAQSTTASASEGASGAIRTLTKGIASGVEEIASLAFGLSFAAFSVFFCLKDGPAIRGFAERRLGRAAAGRPDDPRQSRSRGPPLLHRRHDRRHIQRRRGRSRRVDPRCPARGHDRGRHARDGLRSLHRRRHLGCVRRPARARRRGNVDCADHARDRHPRQRDCSRTSSSRSPSERRSTSARC